MGLQGAAPARGRRQRGYRRRGQALSDRDAGRPQDAGCPKHSGRGLPALHVGDQSAPGSGDRPGQGLGLRLGHGRLRLGQGEGEPRLLHHEPVRALPRVQEGEDPVPARRAERAPARHRPARGALAETRRGAVADREDVPSSAEDRAVRTRAGRARPGRRRLADMGGRRE